jgi:signal transduction histidine kinase
VFYLSFGYILKSTIENDFPDAHDQGDQAMIQIMNDTRNGVVIIDVIAFVLTGIFSYGLAGKTLEPIKKTLNAQKAFSSNASHELRTPLAVMKSDCEVALRNPKTDNAEMRNVIQSNLEEVDRMGQMVENLLKLSRLETKNDSFSQRINVSEIVAEAAARIKILADFKDIQLKIEKNRQLEIAGSHEYLELLFFNLLQNAVNYNKPNGEVQVKYVQEENIVKIIIEDTGVGIDSKDLPHIFERFYKADKNRAQNTSGAGIGLSIVKEIAEKHQGKAEIKSDPGAGTRITVSFPTLSLPQK